MSHIELGRGRDMECMATALGGLTPSKLRPEVEPSPNTLKTSLACDLTVGGWNDDVHQRPFLYKMPLFDSRGLTSVKLPDRLLLDLNESDFSGSREVRPE